MIPILHNHKTIFSNSQRWCDRDYCNSLVEKDPGENTIEYILENVSLLFLLSQKISTPFYVIPGNIKNISIYCVA